MSNQRIVTVTMAIPETMTVDELFDLLNDSHISLVYNIEVIAAESFSDLC